MHRNKSVDVHAFSMIPRADIPRSSFRIQKAHKTTFDAGYLIPVYVDEVLPGDTFNVKMTAFARLATPIFPIMDNMYLDSFFFFVPNRLVWNNWQKFMGEQENPGDSTSYEVPHIVTPAGGYAINSLQDYMGLPTVGNYKLAPANPFKHSALWLRAYNLIWNEWFRDENLQNSVVVNKGDGPDLPTAYTLLRRGKRHDYFTSCLPWTQKGPSVSLPLNGQAPVLGIGFSNSPSSAPVAATGIRVTGATSTENWAAGRIASANQPNETWIKATGTTNAAYPDVYADLSQATAATINQIRQAFQIQKLLERDARGGTRYTELVRAHFGVISPDARLQRPEYLGGGSAYVNITEIAQQSETKTDGTPLGTLGAKGTVVAGGHGFSQSFTEHGMIIGLVAVRADLTYQQGVRKMWTRKTKYDFYFPVFAALGEQAVLNKELFCVGDNEDDDVFGYQERWAEYRYNPSMITGYMKSTMAGSLDAWHLGQWFGNTPTLNATFIEDNPPMARVIAVDEEANGKQFIFDSFFDVRAARPLPMYGVPGLIDHF